MGYGDSFSKFVRDKLRDHVPSAADAPVDSTVDGRLEVIMDFMRTTGVSSLKEAVGMLGDNAKYPYAMYAGRMAKKYPDLAQKFGVPVAEIAGMDKTERVKQGAIRDSSQFAFGMMDFFQYIDTEGYKDTLNSITSSAPFEYVGWEEHDREGLGIGKKTVEGGLDVMQEIYDKERATQDTRVKKMDSNEAMWKSYNAELDDSESGLDLPYNLAGLGGEMLPGMLLGGGVSRAGGALVGKGLQIATAFGTNAAYEFLKYQQHQDKLEAGFGIASGGFEFLPGGKILRNLSPVRKGQLMGNWLEEAAGRFAGTAKTFIDKEGITKGAADRGYNFWKSLEKGDLSMPFEWIKSPKRTANSISKETRDIPMGAMGEQKKKIFQKAMNLFKGSLDKLGKSKEDLAKFVPPEHADNPYGWLLMNNIKKVKSKYSKEAEPYRLAAEKVGDKIGIDPAQLSAFSGNKDLTSVDSYEILNRAIRSVNNPIDVSTMTPDELIKHIATREALDKLPIRAEAFANLNANQLAQIVKNLRRELNAGGGGGFSTKDDTSKGEIGRWLGKARTMLSELDPSYSVPYNKAQSIYSESLSKFGNEGDNTIAGLSRAYGDKNYEKLAQLFLEGNTENLKKATSWLEPDNMAGLVRGNIESKISDSTTAGKGIKGEMLDTKQLDTDLEGLDFDSYRELLKDSSGIDGLSALSGMGREIKEKGIQGIFNAIEKTKLDVNDMKSSPLQDVKDTLRLRLSRENRPYYKYLGNNPTLPQKLKALPAMADTYEDLPSMIYGPRVQKLAYKRQLDAKRGDEVLTLGKTLRKLYGMSKEIVKRNKGE